MSCLESSAAKQALANFVTDFILRNLEYRDRYFNAAQILLPLIAVQYFSLWARAEWDAEIRGFTNDDYVCINLEILGRVECCCNKAESAKISSPQRNFFSRLRNFNLGLMQPRQLAQFRTSDLQICFLISNVAESRNTSKLNVSNTKRFLGRMVDPRLK